MRFKVLALALLVVAMIGTSVDTAAAVSPKMPFGWARKQSKALINEYCVNRPSCVWWKVGHCARFSRSRVDCGAAVEFRSGEYCSLVVVNKATNDGYLKQRVRRARCE